MSRKYRRVIEKKRYEPFPIPDLDQYLRRVFHLSRFHEETGGLVLYERNFITGKGLPRPCQEEVPEEGVIPESGVRFAALLGKELVPVQVGEYLAGADDAGQPLRRGNGHAGEKSGFEQEFLCLGVGLLKDLNGKVVEYLQGGGTGKNTIIKPPPSGPLHDQHQTRGPAAGPFMEHLQHGIGKLPEPLESQQVP